jgi:hypothetical protein
MLFMTATIALASCSSPPVATPASPSPTISTPTTVQSSALPANDVAQIEVGLRRFLSDYNDRNWPAIAGYFSEAITSGCGGAEDMAEAYKKNRSTEKLVYSLDRLDKKSATLDGRDQASVDVYYSSRDEGSGEVVDQGRGAGLDFVREDTWKLAEHWVGAGAFC